MPPELEFDTIIKADLLPMDRYALSMVRNLMSYQGLPALPDWWNYRWSVDKDPEHGYTGNFPKRIKKWLFAEKGIKVTDKLVSDLGENIKRYLPQQETVYMDFTRNLGWTPGMFGDDGSCFWSDRDDARQVLLENDGFAMRRWTVDKRPIGRCWVAPKNNCFVMFNAYCNEGFGTTGIAHFANILAAYLKLSLRHGVDITNLGRDSGLLYINGSTGSVVGEPEVVDGISAIDLQMDVSEYGLLCNYCGVDLWGLTYETRANGYVRCPGCRRDGRTTPLHAIPQLVAA